MNGLESIAASLKTYGGWGVAVVLGFVVYKMATYIVKLHKEQKDDAKVVSSLLEGVKMSLDAFTRSQERLTDKVVERF